ncbi:MAG: metalloregulator ArsR/SmtB family transcription factor [Actinomycetota bacterium]
MDAVARALAEPNRRTILRIVRDDERTVGEIAEQLSISRPAVSQHLRVLEEAELVTIRPQGTRRWYRARPEGLGELRSWIEDFWTQQLLDLKREVEQEVWRNRRRPQPDTHHTEGPDR